MLSSDKIPPCAASMGCLCAGHARGASADVPCDTREQSEKVSVSHLGRKDVFVATVDEAVALLSRRFRKGVTVGPWSAWERVPYYGGRTVEVSVASWCRASRKPCCFCDYDGKLVRHREVE